VISAPVPDTPPRSYVVPGFLALSAIWGASFLFIKVGVRELHPVYLTVGRLALGVVTMLILLVIMRDGLPRSLRVWAHMAVVGILGMAIPYTLFGYGEQRISSVLAGIWNATIPLMALPLAALVFRTERLTARKVAGIGVGFVGVLVVLGVWQGAGGSALTGQLLCLAAAACYGVTIPYIKRFLSGESISGPALVAGQLLAGTVVLAAVAPLIAGAPPAPASLSADVVASVLTLGVLGTGIAFLLHFRNIRLVGASAASLVTYLIPVFAVVAGVAVLDESLRWFQPVGTLIVLSGVALSQGIPVSLRRTPRPAPAVVPATSST
jgi:drug/metabolite transporter (DMT)-like permease